MIPLRVPTTLALTLRAIVDPQGRSKMCLSSPPRRKVLMSVNIGSSSIKPNLSLIKNQRKVLVKETKDIKIKRAEEDMGTKSLIVSIMMIRPTIKHHLTTKEAVEEVTVSISPKAASMMISNLLKVAEITNLVEAEAAEEA